MAAYADFAFNYACQAASEPCRCVRNEYCCVAKLQVAVAVQADIIIIIKAEMRQRINIWNFTLQNGMYLEKELIVWHV